MGPASSQLPWISAGITHRGAVRQLNEDAYLDRPDIGLWAVADGMGGHAAGDFASRLVVQALEGAAQQKYLGQTITSLRNSLAEANRRLCGEAQQRGVAVIGCTVAALAAVPGHCVLLWAGDSRIYRLRKGNLQQLSRDHSYVQELVDRGLLSPDSAETHPAGNIVTRAVGAAATLEVDTQICEIQSGDYYLLCTDGLTKEVPENEIAELLGQSAVDELPRVLVDQACQRGGRDNVTAVVVKCDNNKSEKAV